MIAILKGMWATLVAVGLAIVMILIATLTNVDLINLNLKLLNGIEKNEIDDLLIAGALICVGLTIDLWQRRKRQQAEIDAQKLRTLKATMRTVQDIVNNFLNNLLLFQMDAAAVMPHGSLDSIEELSQQTYQKLKALGDLESVRETPLATGAGIEYPDNRPISLMPAAVTPREVPPKTRRELTAQ
jgi:hypothetical protein